MNFWYVTALICIYFGTLPGCIRAEFYNGELKPTLRSATTPSYFTNKSPIEVLVEFNRIPDKVNTDAFKVENATINLITKLSETTYKVELLPASQGLLSLVLPAGSAFGNRGEASLSSGLYEVHFDDILPTVDLAEILPFNVSYNPQPTISGMTEPKAIVTVYDSITCSGNILNNGTADAINGSFHVTLGQPLTIEGQYAWSVLAEDAAGNTYCYPYPLAYTFDKTQPSLPVISLINGPIQDNPIAIDLLTCDDDNQSPDNFYQILFTQDSAAVPSIDDPNWQSCFGGAHDFSLSGDDGAHSIIMWARDQAGNISSSNQLSVVLDTKNPSLEVALSFEIQRHEELHISADNISSDEEGFGLYSLGSAGSPQCSNHGTVTIDSETGALLFVPATNYYNHDSGSDYYGGPCKILVQFQDQVSPTPHLISKEISVTVHFIDEPVKITAWPGDDGTNLEKCGNKCFANSIFDLSFIATPGGAPYHDHQAFTCTAVSSDTYYASIASCSIDGDHGTLAVQMESAHALLTEGTAITITVSDGITTDSQTFYIHVDNYMMSMYPALAVSKQIGCILCHANIQADVVTDFGVPASKYTNANDILGPASLGGSHLYHNDNNLIDFFVSGAIYMPDITVTDKNAIKQITGSPNGVASFNLRSFLLNSWNYYAPIIEQGSIAMDPDGYVKVNPTPITMPAHIPGHVQGGLQIKSSIKIRAPSDAEILNLDSSLAANVTSFVYKGPQAKPAFSGLEVANFGYGEFVRNSGTIVCHGSIIISGTLYLYNPDIQTDDVGCSIYVAGNVFIETNRGTAIQYIGSGSPTLQLTSSRYVHLGIGLYDLHYIRRGMGNFEDAQKIANAANPYGLRDAAEGALSIKTNADASAWEWMRCPLRPEHGMYLDRHYISNGNYSACDPSVDPWKCAMAKELFSNWIGTVSGYSYVADNKVINNGGTLINPVQAYELLCRTNGGYQMGNYANIDWTWAGYFGEKPDMVGAGTINSLRVSTIFDHVRINAHYVHSRYYGEFRGSVIAPWALFAVGNLVFRYDTRLNSVVPFPRLMVPNPIFDVQ